VVVVVKIINKMTNIEKSLLKFGEELVADMKIILETAGKDATGELIRSLEPYTEDEDGLTFLYINMAAHGVYVDSGRKPGLKRPPKEPIRKWVQAKGIRGNISEDSLVYLIQRKIGIRGIKALPFLNLFYDAANELAEIVEESAALDIEQNLDDFIKKYNK